MRHAAVGDDGQTASIKGTADWRGELKAYARDVWATHASPLEPSDAARRVVERALGDKADAAFDLIAALALGKRHLAGGGASHPDLGGLDTVLDGLAAAQAGSDGREAARASPPPVIQSALWQVLQKVRESAELSYSRQFDLVELDRRILLLLQGVGPLVPMGLAAAVGVDKAQVSRSVKRLLELRMVERQQIRSPLKLTRKGETAAGRLLRLADLRNRELTFDIGDEELAEFFAVIEILLDRSMLLYEQERELAARGGEAPPAAGERRPAEKVVIDRSRIVSPLMTLSAYFSRSGALAYRRLTRLSNFEAFVLSEIGMHPPIEWAALVKVLQRDHSQAGRTINALIERGLVRREGKPGRRHGLFAPTGRGQELHKVIHDAGRKRSEFLLAPLDEQKRGRFLSTFDRIRRNAVAQLARERAFADLERE